MILTGNLRSNLQVLRKLIEYIFIIYIIISITLEIYAKLSVNNGWLLIQVNHGLCRLLSYMLIVH